MILKNRCRLGQFQDVSFCNRFLDCHYGSYYYYYIIQFVLADKCLCFIPCFWAPRNSKSLRTIGQDMQSGEETNIGPNYTNIHSVTYSSDGRFLNSTLWFPSLSGLTSSNGKPSADVITYGIMIDADLNGDSGFQGVDYELQISWNNNTKAWTQTLIEYASDGNSRRISPAADTNFTGFI